MAFHRVLSRRIRVAVTQAEWTHIAFKAFAYTYVAFILWLAWHLGPLGKLWLTAKDTIPRGRHNLVDYFTEFEGYSDCDIRASDLYLPPTMDEHGKLVRGSFCAKRSQLLEAMSSGGRRGFDAPYTARGCHYRWYTVAELCMVMERFDAVIFLGDSTLRTIYNGLNILLRHDLSLGTLKTWEMTPEERDQCRCANQFVKEGCVKYHALSSEDVIRNVEGKRLSSYACQRTPHLFLDIDKSPAPESVVSAFQKMVPAAPPSNHKPIPIIHSLTLANSVSLAAKSMTEFLNLADASKRKTPMLWIGPPAAGHIEIKGRKGNQEIWHFATEMERISKENGVEVLGMWNMTVQAESWDGLRFDEKVAVTQAMMVFNWLSRLESS